MSAQAAEKFFQKNAALPAMPEVASRLLKSFDDDNISLSAIAELVGKDSTLAAKVLRLANSARYSPSHQISSLQDAAAALGMDTLRNLALGACLAGAFPVVKGLGPHPFLAAQHQHRSLCTHPVQCRATGCRHRLPRRADAAHRPAADGHDRA